MKEAAKNVVFIKKDASKVIVRKLDVSENSKVYYYGRFLENGLHEWYCYISKSRWDVQYLEACQLLFISQEIKMELDNHCFC